jgi:hypothetical protein
VAEQQRIDKATELIQRSTELRSELRDMRRDVMEILRRIDSFKREETATSENSPRYESRTVSKTAKTETLHGEKFLKN